MDIAKVRVRNRQYDIPHKCNDINSCLPHPVFACSCPPCPFFVCFSPTSGLFLLLNFFCSGPPLLPFVSVRPLFLLFMSPPFFFGVYLYLLSQTFPPPLHIISCIFIVAACYDGCELCHLDASGKESNCISCINKREKPSGNKCVSSCGTSQYLQNGFCRGASKIFYHFKATSLDTILGRIICSLSLCEKMQITVDRIKGY